jgi:hypothetical protein
LPVHSLDSVTFRDVRKSVTRLCTRSMIPQSTFWGYVVSP